MLYITILGTGSTVFAPFEVLFVPFYLMLAGWGNWLDTFKALIQSVASTGLKA